MVKRTFGKIEQKSLARNCMHQYEIVGRAAPTQKNPVPKIYKLKLFAKNPVIARSKFWFFMKRINKAKKSGGEILRMTELFEKHPEKVNNYAINLRHNSRTDTHNMHKEFRDTTLNGAVTQMIAEMAGRHRAESHSIQILNTAMIKDEECVRPHVIAMHKNNLKFPVVRKRPLVAKKMRSIFRANRPSTFVQ